MIPLVWGIQISQTQRQSRIRLPGVEVSSYLMVTVSHGENKALEMDGEDIFTAM